MILLYEASISLSGRKTDVGIGKGYFEQRGQCISKAIGKNVRSNKQECEYQ